MQPLKEALDEILTKLVDLNRPLAHLLQEGLLTEAIYEQSKTLPVQFSQEIVELYSWRNGTKIHEGNPLIDLYFFPGYYFLSLENACSDYESFRDSELIELGLWKLNWFPLFTSGGGDYYVVDCPDDLAAAAPVISYIRGEPEHEVIYTSLTSMMQTIAECYKAGVYQLVGESWNIDFVAEARIAQKYNPGISY